jgi:translocation and assembly module TamB
MQAQLSAQIAPWQTQALVQAQGQWQALDLAALWPQAPRTGLSGQAKVTPKGSEWLGQITLTNSLPGPWNLQQLPLSTLQADINYQQGGWTIQALSASSGAGTVKGGGTANTGLWQGKFELNNIDPSLLDSRLASTTLSGQINAQQSAGGIGFDVQLQANSAAHQAARPTALQALELQSLLAQGLWQKPLLTLQRLEIKAVDAQLQGKLSYQLDSQAATATLALTLPGLQTQLDGQIARSDGQGTLNVDVSNLQQASRWLSRWPAVASALQNYQLDGNGQFQASWHGGWQNQGQALQLEAKLQAPQLSWRTLSSGPDSTAQNAQISKLQMQLNGSLAALELSSQGQLETAKRQSHWQAQAAASLLGSGHWRGHLNALNLQTEDSTRPGLWKLQLAKAGLPWEWQSSGGTRSANLGAGNAQLSGPQQGAVQLNWQPLSWSQASPTGGATAKAQWQSQGQLSGLPLSWLDAVSQKSLNDLGLSSDMLLAGQWQASQNETLHLGITLERSSGDLRLRTDESRQLLLPAGMKEARLDVNLDGDYLSSSLRWDSQRAGQALVAFSTQLSPSAQGWSLAGNAPVGGGIQIQLPPVDAWSVLAPPGWRLRGTMNANIALAGTLDLPQWSGQLQARDLAVRSVVDGIDFSQGTLSARMHEQQLDIEKFSLQGASSGSTGGGQLDLSGSVFWLPNHNPSKPLSQVRIALTLQAKALRLNTRSDRRMIMSGDVSALLQDSKLMLRGGLVVDQARITLPDDNAPKLGDDVIVHRTASPAETAKAQAKTNDTSLRITPDLHIEFDLGKDFQISGRGLDTRLSGKLELQTIDGNPPTLVGTVNTVRGTFQAYGQKLNIEQGELRFVGPPTNPVLNILAIRPNLSQRVGAQVLGTALSPVVRLYSEPDLPEAEKLAWLVLGRSASGSGGEAALLQQAALALLGGSGKGPSTSLSQALGIDELSFRSNSGTASSATLTIGKRLSQDFYVAYEGGLAGTMGMFSIFYELSKRLTVRAQTGQQTAVDLIWTHQYD